MCQYILPLLVDTVTPVQQGMFDTFGLCEIHSHTKQSRLRPRTTLKLKAKAKAKDLMHQCQGQRQGFWP